MRLAPSIAMLVLCGSCSVASAQERVIHVKIRVVDERGLPVESVPVISGNRAGTAYWGGVSDANGIIEKDMTIDAAETLVWLRMGPRPTKPLEAPDPETGYAYDVVLDKNALRIVWCETVSANQSSYEWTATAARTRSVRFKTVQNGQYVEAYPFTNFIHRVRIDDATKVMTLSAVPKAEDIDVVFICNDSVLREWTIPASLQDSEDLGELTIPEVSSNATVDVTMRNMIGMETRLLKPGTGATLVSADGAIVVDLQMHNGKGIGSDVNGYGPIRVPAGTYWVSPQSWSKLGTTGVLLRLVRSGVDLSESEIPRVEIPEGAAVPLEIDGKSAEDAILATGAAHGIGPCHD